MRYVEDMKLKPATVKRLQTASALLAAHRRSIADIRASLSDLGIVDEVLAKVHSALGEADVEIDYVLEGQE